MEDSLIRKDHAESISLLNSLSNLPSASVELYEHCVYSSAVANATGTIIAVQAKLKQKIE